MEDRLYDSPNSKEQSRGEVTDLLVKWSEGDNDALEKLLPIVYAELRRIADGYLRRERSGHTLQPTALVHEAYMRLIKAQGLEWKNHEQFFGIAANLMRQILVDHARASSAAKRGGSAPNFQLEEALTISADSDDNLLLLDEALNKLATIDPQAARIVELRYFAGLTIEETAEVLKISPMTIKREWATARAWLHREIAGN
jgi:RNA polymerase sigma factor (TIGR02999 family)